MSVRGPRKEEKNETRVSSHRLSLQPSAVISKTLTIDKIEM
jgi:hypothetical protein